MYIENINLRNSISSWLLFMFFIIAIMIIVGGLTRLTDSGLSITEWELFAGFLPPLNQNEWNKGPLQRLRAVVRLRRAPVGRALRCF